MNRLINAIQTNKKLILISISSSLLTFLIISLGLFGLVRTGFIDLSSLESGDNTSDSAILTGTAAEESQIIKTVEKTSPAVVSIVITKKVSDTDRSSGLFGDLFDLLPQPEGDEEQEVGQGSGFFVSSDGYIVTNRHVVSEENATYSVLTSDGSKYNAKVLAKDSTYDVAILKVSGSDFAHLSFADSDTIKVGQKAIAIGNALGEFQNSVSAGIVSGLLRSITAGNGVGDLEQLEGVIQTDAAINPGNSGGPLLDIRGNVIGVNVAVSDSAENIGFALPSNMVRDIYNSVKEHGEIIRPYLGVRYNLITKEVAQDNNLPFDYGALVVRGNSVDEPAVIPGSPADKAGIKENDIILEIDGVKLDKNKSPTSVIRQKKVGQTITIKLSHQGETKDIKVSLDKAPKSV